MQSTFRPGSFQNQYRQDPNQPTTSSQHYGPVQQQPGAPHADATAYTEAAPYQAPHADGFVPAQQQEWNPYGPPHTSYPPAGYAQHGYQNPQLSAHGFEQQHHNGYEPRYNTGPQLDLNGYPLQQQQAPTTPSYAPTAYAPSPQYTPLPSPHLAPQQNPWDRPQTNAWEQQPANDQHLVPVHAHSQSSSPALRPSSPLYAQIANYTSPSSSPANPFGHQPNVTQVDYSQNLPAHNPQFGGGNTGVDTQSWKQKGKVKHCGRPPKAPGVVGAGLQYGFTGKPIAESHFIILDQRYDGPDPALQDHQWAEDGFTVGADLGAAVGTGMADAGVGGFVSVGHEREHIEQQLLSPQEVAEKRHLQHESIATKPSNLFHRPLTHSKIADPDSMKIGAQSTKRSSSRLAGGVVVSGFMSKAAAYAEYEGINEMSVRKEDEHTMRVSVRPRHISRVGVLGSAAKVAKMTSSTSNMEATETVYLFDRREPAAKRAYEQAIQWKLPQTTAEIGEHGPLVERFSAALPPGVTVESIETVSDVTVDNGVKVLTNSVLGASSHKSTSQRIREDSLGTTVDDGRARTRSVSMAVIGSGSSTVGVNSIYRTSAEPGAKPEHVGLGLSLNLSTVGVNDEKLAGRIVQSAVQGSRIDTTQRMLNKINAATNLDLPSYPTGATRYLRTVNIETELSKEDLRALTLLSSQQVSRIERDTNCDPGALGALLSRMRGLDDKHRIDAAATSQALVPAKTNWDALHIENAQVEAAASGPSHQAAIAQSNLLRNEIKRETFSALSRALQEIPNATGAPRHVKFVVDCEAYGLYKKSMQGLIEKFGKHTADVTLPVEDLVERQKMIQKCRDDIYDGFEALDGDVVMDAVRPDEVQRIHSELVRALNALEQMDDAGGLTASERISYMAEKDVFPHLLPNEQMRTLAALKKVGRKTDHLGDEVKIYDAMFEFEQKLTSKKLPLDLVKKIKEECVEARDLLNAETARIDSEQQAETQASQQWSSAAPGQYPQYPQYENGYPQQPQVSNQVWNGQQWQADPSQVANQFGQLAIAPPPQPSYVDNGFGQQHSGYGHAVAPYNANGGGYAPPPASYGNGYDSSYNAGYNQYGSQQYGSQQYGSQQYGSQQYDYGQQPSSGYSDAGYASQVAPTAPPSYVSSGNIRRELVVILQDDNAIAKETRLGSKTQKPLLEEMRKGLHELLKQTDADLYLTPVHHALREQAPMRVKTKEDIDFLIDGMELEGKSAKVGNAVDFITRSFVKQALDDIDFRAEVAVFSADVPDAHVVEELGQYVRTKIGNEEDVRIGFLRIGQNKQTKNKMLKLDGDSTVIESETSTGPMKDRIADLKAGLRDKYADKGNDMSATRIAARRARNGVARWFSDNNEKKLPG